MQNFKLKIIFISIIFSGVLLLPEISFAQSPIDNLQPGEWYEVPNSSLSASGQLPDCGNWCGNGQNNIMAAWNGGAFDTKRNRLIVWGGGHGDYGGNEIYTFDISTFRWTRNWGPSPDIPYDYSRPCAETYSDGNPASRHTYDGLVYLQALDKFWSAGGSLWCGGGGGSRATWTFDFNALVWQRKIDTPYLMGVTAASDYDPVTGHVFHENTEAYSINEYDPANNIWTRRAVLDGVPLGSEMNAVIDPVNRLFVVVGNGYIHALNLQTGQVFQPSTTGGSAVINTRGPGLVYDPVIKKIVGWPGGNLNGIRDTQGDTSVYSLDVTTWTWTKHTAAPSNTVIPTGATRVGVFGRFQYIPSKNAYILVNAVNENVFIYKLSSATPPPPSGQINLPLRQWVAIPSPTPFGGGAKHVSGALDPDNGRLYLEGGDFPGSYKQETWSLSLSERWSDKMNPGAGLRLEYDECGPVGQVQPKHPDFVGWSWDSNRKVFWYIPGEAVISSTNCPGETYQAISDPGFLWNRLMTFNPSTQRWADAGPAQAPFGDQWGSVYDPVTDSIIRFSGYSTAKVETYNITQGAWSSRIFNLIAFIDRGPIANAVDFKARVIYTIDPHNALLYRYNINSQSFENLGSVPGGPMTCTYGQPQFIWDSTDNVLLFYRDPNMSDCSGGNFPNGDFQAYHPDTGTWEQLSVSTDLAGVNLSGIIFMYDSIQNAVVLISRYPSTPIGGSSAYYMFLYRYGPGQPTQDTTAPSIPTNLVATAISSSQINLSWSPSADSESGISYYRIYRNNTYIAQSNSTSYSDTFVSPSTTYTYQVSAVNGVGLESTKGTSVSATTPYAPPSLVSNLSVSSGRTYQVVNNGLQLGALVYIDRSFTFNSIPTFLQGKTYIKTANDDKDLTGTNFLTFQTNQNTTVYIAYDNRIITKPSWLSSFTDTNQDLSTDDSTFRLYQKNFSSGTITLGGNQGGGNSMYSVIIASQGTTDTTPPQAPSGVTVN